LQQKMQSVIRLASAPEKLGMPSKRGLSWGSEDEDQGVVVARKRMREMHIDIIASKTTVSDTASSTSTTGRDQMDVMSEPSIET
jgi:hypothetical protein